MLYKKIQEQQKNQSLANLEHEEVRISENLKYLPINPLPSYIHIGMFVLCLKGSARLSIHDNEHVLVENELAIIFPGQLVALTEVSDDFLTDTLIISHSLFDEVLSGITRFSPHFFFYMHRNYWYSIEHKDISYFKNYYALVRDKVNDSQYLFKREFVIHILRILYLDVYSDYCNKAEYEKNALDVRKGELVQDFFYLLMKHYKTYRDVSYYADKMCITPKYLSAVIKEISGKTAKEWIVEYIILEIKALLRHSSLNIQEIAVQTGFANQSSLGRFFRKHIGSTLTDFRIK